MSSKLDPLAAHHLNNRCAHSWGSYLLPILVVDIYYGLPPGPTLMYNDNVLLPYGFFLAERIVPRPTIIPGALWVRSRWKDPILNARV